MYALPLHYIVADTTKCLPIVFIALWLSQVKTLLPSSRPASVAGSTAEYCKRQELRPMLVHAQTGSAWTLKHGTALKALLTVGAPRQVLIDDNCLEAVVSCMTEAAGCSYVRALYPEHLLLRSC